MKPICRIYIIYDARYRSDPARALVLEYFEGTLADAKQQAMKAWGEDSVIVEYGEDPASGYLVAKRIVN